jgi:hypothetical protein
MTLLLNLFSLTLTKLPCGPDITTLQLRDSGDRVLYVRSLISTELNNKAVGNYSRAILCIRAAALRWMGADNEQRRSIGG